MGHVDVRTMALMSAAGFLAACGAPAPAVSTTAADCMDEEHGAGPFALSSDDADGTEWNCRLERVRTQPGAELGFVRSAELPELLFQGQIFDFHVTGTAGPEAEYLLAFMANEEGLEGRGFTTFPISPGRIDLEIDARAPGAFDALLGVAFGRDDADGGRMIGDIFYVELGEIVRRTGDLQVSLHWDTPADLDLVLVSEDGEREATTTSREACLFDVDQTYESVSLRHGVGGPTRVYVVEVRMYDDCGTHFDGVDTPYTVHVNSDQGFDTVESVFEPFEWGSPANVPENAIQRVGEFDFR